jgi:hypothetical protein
MCTVSKSVSFFFSQRCLLLLKFVACLHPVNFTKTILAFIFYGNHDLQQIDQNSELGALMKIIVNYAKKKFLLSLTLPKPYIRSEAFNVVRLRSYFHNCRQIGPRAKNNHVNRTVFYAFSKSVNKSRCPHQCT